MSEPEKAEAERVEGRNSGRRLNRLWRCVRSSPGLLLALYTCALLLVFTRGLISTELDDTGDAVYHLAAEAQVAQAIREGRNPLGPIDLSFGTPLLKFYQPLLYLVNGAIAAVANVDSLVVHNLSIVFLFLLTPFVLCYAYRSIGLPELAAGIAALLSPLSIAGFGASFESFFGTAVINQLAGAVFFPLFIAVFTRVVRDGVYPLRAAALFAFTFLAHVMMAVYAVFAGALLFAVEKRDLRRMWKPLALFCSVSVLLVAFWVIPFVTLQSRHRPLPDLVAQPWGAFMQSGYTAGEATRMLFTGRLLDDARDPAVDSRTGDDALSDKMNMFRSGATRPPVLTVIAILGFALCLLRIREFAYRFLVAGFAFSFLLLMGPDDIPWIGYLPFAGKIQFFRCTYLLEFFAFGLGGAGLEMIISFARRRLGRLPRGAKIAAACGGAAIALVGLVGHFALVHKLAVTQVDTLPTDRFDRAVKVASPVLDGTPGRLQLSCRNYTMDKRYGAYLNYSGMSYVCGHWRVMGPVVANDLCSSIKESGGHLGVSRRVGVRYFFVNRPRAGKLGQMEHSPGKKSMRQLGRGGGQYVYEDTRSSFLWDATPSVLTVATDAQWLFLSRSWLTVTAATREDDRPPTPVLLPRETPIDAALLAPFEAVWILDPARLGQADVRALEAYGKSSGKVFSAAAVPGLGSAELFPPDKKVMRTVPVRKGTEIVRMDLRPAPSALGPFDFVTRSPRPAVVVLPEFAVEGWTARVNGAPARVMAAGPSMVSVAVPRGKSRVVLEWKTPRREAILAGVSGLAWLGLLAGFVWTAVRRRRGGR